MVTNLLALCAVAGRQMVPESCQKKEEPEVATAGYQDIDFQGNRSGDEERSV